MHYVRKLRKTTRLAEFLKLGTGEMSIEDELIEFKLIESLCDASNKHKIFERLPLTKMFLDVSRQFLQKLELTEILNTSKSNAEVYSTSNNLVGCKYCNKSMNEKMSSIWSSMLELC